MRFLKQILQDKFALHRNEDPVMTAIEAVKEWLVEKRDMLATQRSVHYAYEKQIYVMGLLEELKY